MRHNSRDGHRIRLGTAAAVLLLAVLVVRRPAADDGAAPENYPTSVPVTAVAFGPQAKTVFTSGFHEVTEWNAVTGGLVRRLPAAGRRVYGLATTSDRSLLAVASGNAGETGEVRTVPAGESGEPRVLFRDTFVLRAVAFRPDDALLAAAGDHTAVLLFDVATGKPTGEIETGCDEVRALAWSPDGARIAAACGDGAARVFDAEKGELVARYAGHAGPVRAVAFSRDGQRVFSVGTAENVHEWKADSGERVRVFGELGGTALDLEVGDEWLFVPGTGRKVHQLKTRDGQPARKPYEHSDWLMCVDFDPQTKRLTAGAADGRVLVWTAADGKAVSNFVAAPHSPARKKKPQPKQNDTKKSASRKSDALRRTQRIKGLRRKSR